MRSINQKLQQLNNDRMIIVQYAQCLIIGVLVFGMNQQFVHFAFAKPFPLMLEIALMVGVGLTIVVYKKIYTDLLCVLLAIGMAFFSCKVDSTGVVDCYALSSVLMYIFATQIIVGEHQRAERSALALCKAVFGGALAFQLLEAFSLIRYLIDGGNVWMYRGWYYFWSGNSDYIYITVIVFAGCIMSSLIMYGVVLMKEGKKKLGLFYVINSILWIGFYIAFDSRMGFFVPLMVFVTVGISYAFSIKQMCFNSKKIIVFLVVGVALVTLVRLALAQTGLDVFLSKTLFSNRDGGIIHNIRFQSMQSIVAHLKDYPLGGMPESITLLPTGHSAWTEIAAVAGWKPFVFILLFSCSSFVGVVKIWRLNTVSIKARTMIVSMYLAVFIYQLMEPTLLFETISWFVYVMFCGVVSGLNEIANCEKN